MRLKEGTWPGHILEHVTLEDIVTGQLPGAVNELLESPGAWERR